MAAKVSPFAPKTFPDLPPIDGVRIATAEAGIRYRNRTDLLFVGLDEGTLGVRRPVVDEDGRHRGSLRHRLVTEPDHDQAVDLRGGEGLQRLRLSALDPDSVREQRDRVASPDLHHEGTIQFGVVGQGGIWRENAGEPGAASPEPARQSVRPIPEFARRAQNLLTCLRGYRTRPVVEDVADDRDGESGRACDVSAGDGHAVCLSVAPPWRVC